MKRSGCRTIFHICLIFVLSLLGALLMAVRLFFLTITIRKPDGKTARSDWPIRFTEEFKDQIIFAGAGWYCIYQCGIAGALSKGTNGKQRNNPLYGRGFPCREGVRLYSVLPCEYL